MFRLLLRTPLCWARQAKKPKAEMDLSEEQEVSTGRGLRSKAKHYQQTKPKLSKIDHEDLQDEEGTEEFKNTMEFFRKMMEDQNPLESKEQPKIPKPNLRQKLKSMETPEDLLPNDPNDPNFPTQLWNNNAPISQSDYLSPEFSQHRKQFQQQLTQMSAQEFKKKEKEELALAQQDLLLDDIMKQTREKQIKIRERKHKNSPNPPDEDTPTEREQKLILRREKILEAIQKKQDPSQMKLEVTRQDLLTMKYSPQIIAKASEYRNRELNYFKELVNSEEEQIAYSTLHQRRFKNKEDEAEYLQQKKKQDLLELNYKKKEIKQNSYRNIKAEEGLLPYEDVQYYKDKADKQIKEKHNLTQQDRDIKTALENDLEKANTVSNVFLDQVVFPMDGKLERGLTLDNSSFGKQKKQTKQLVRRLNNLEITFNPAQIKQLSKQFLFEQKNFLEKQAGFQKYLHRKEKKKHMQKQLRNVHASTLRDDLDFDKQEETMSIKDIKNTSDVEMLEDDFKKLEDYEQQKNSVLVQETAEQKASNIYHIKTFRNMQTFIALYFAEGLVNHNAAQLNQIQILQITPNHSNTLINIFWDIEPEHLKDRGIEPGCNDYQAKYEAEKKKLWNRLNRQAPYISGKMTQMLRLRYGPEIRFHFDTRTKETLEGIKELKKYVHEIAMVEMEEYKSKGLIKTKKEEREYYDKLLDVARGKLFNFHNRTQLLSKKYKKQHRDELPQPPQPSPQDNTDRKKKRLNPMFEEEQHPSQQEELQTLQLKTKAKKTASEKLWDEIDTL